MLSNFEKRGCTTLAHEYFSTVYHDVFLAWYAQHDRQTEKDTYTPRLNTDIKIHTYFVFHPHTYTHMSPQILTGAAAHLPACLCSVLTSLFAPFCAGGGGKRPHVAAALCRSEPSRARGGGSAAACIP